MTFGRSCTAARGRILAPLAALALLVAGCGKTRDGGDLKWEHDPAKGIELASTLGKPMVLYFTSDG